MPGEGPVASRATGCHGRFSTMWKIILGFVVFAALAMFLLMKSGADVDMSGEKHGAEATAPAPAPGASH